MTINAYRLRAAIVEMMEQCLLINGWTQEEGQFGDPVWVLGDRRYLTTEGAFLHEAARKPQ